MIIEDFEGTMVTVTRRLLELLNCNSWVIADSEEIVFIWDEDLMTAIDEEESGSLRDEVEVVMPGFNPCGKMLYLFK